VGASGSYPVALVLFAAILIGSVMVIYAQQKLADQVLKAKPSNVPNVTMPGANNQQWWQKSEYQQPWNPPPAPPRAPQWQR
jgi:hypothetical protein